MKFDPARCLMVLSVVTAPVCAEFRGSASFMSDAVYRGYSKSRDRPSVAGNLEYGHDDSGLYGGLWLMKVDFDAKNHPDRAELEINPYLGWTRGFAEDWRVDLSAHRYLYDGKLFGRNSDFNELQAALHFRDLLTGRIAFAYDAYNRKTATFAYELTGRHSFSDTWQFSAGMGFYQASELLGVDNFYWNAGLTWYPHRFVALDLRYVDTSAGGYRPDWDFYQFRPRPLDSHLLFTLSVGF